MELPKATRSWPLLAIFIVASLGAVIVEGNKIHPAAVVTLVVIGAISFGAWLVTEVIWLFTHMEDDRKVEEDGEPSTKPFSNDSLS